ncbi:MAG: alpha/beta hydrolase [Desulfamplus sp.]|nr:alpha/beta hydrolase [Desulfamplus sp.]
MTNNSDNINQSFNFSFFTSVDKKQIRWGYMKSNRSCIYLNNVKQRWDLTTNNTAPTNKENIEDNCKGIILLLSGRTEFMEKYQLVSSKLSSMGYHVMSLDWRGQGLSVRELPNQDKGYVKDFQLYINDLKLFFNLYVAPLSIKFNLPINIIAHSMGGHITLRFLSQVYKNGCKMDMLKIEKAILISPMIDIITSPIKRDFLDIVTNWGTRLLANIALNFKLGANYIPGGKDYAIENAKFENNLLTHDWDNFWLEHKEISKNRKLALGGVTWGWLKAAFDSIDALNDKKSLSKIRTAIWILSAEQDRVVSNKAQKQICQTLPNGKFISIPNSRHEILFETEDISKLLWENIANILGTKKVNIL